jgi:hypothetical protein
MEERSIYNYASMLLNYPESSLSPRDDLIDSGFELFNKILKIEPNDPVAHYSLCGLFFAKMDFELSIKHLDQLKNVCIHRPDLLAQSVAIENQFKSILDIQEKTFKEKTTFLLRGEPSKETESNNLISQTGEASSTVSETEEEKQAKIKAQKDAEEKAKAQAEIDKQKKEEAEKEAKIAETKEEMDEAERKYKRLRRDWRASGEEEDRLRMGVWRRKFKSLNSEYQSLTGNESSDSEIDDDDDD